MKDIFTYFFGGLALAMGMYLFVWMMTPSPDPAKAAFENYVAGEKASSVAERKDKFNLALEGYKKLEAENNLQQGSGVLFYNIGNSYFQLEEYPWAAYYYYKALSLSPGDTEIINNLNVTLTKLNLPKLAPQTFFDRTFLLRGFSLPTRFQFLFISALLCFGSFLAYLWYNDNKILNLVIVAGCFTVFFFGNTFYETYVVPVEGVLVKPASIYRDAGAQYAKVTEEYLKPGLKVEVLDQRQNGQWLKIMTPDGHLGYVSADSLRLL